MGVADRDSRATAGCSCGRCGWRQQEAVTQRSFQVGDEFAQYSRRLGWRAGLGKFRHGRCRRWRYRADRDLEFLMLSGGNFIGLVHGKLFDYFRRFSTGLSLGDLNFLLHGRQFHLLLASTFPSFGEDQAGLFDHGVCEVKTQLFDRFRDALRPALVGFHVRSVRPLGEGSRRRLLRYLI